MLARLRSSGSGMVLMCRYLIQGLEARRTVVSKRALLVLV